jgi:hypothetical protein
VKFYFYLATTLAAGTTKAKFCRAARIEVRSCECTEASYTKRIK